MEKLAMAVGKDTKKVVDKKPRRVVTFNVKYSENVGDGVIAECMEKAALALGADMVTIDLAGRGAYGTQTVAARSIVLRVLGMLPPFLRRRVVRVRLSRMLSDKAPEWCEVLEGADLVMVGGGNLLQDDGLNFPLKVGAALDTAKEAGVPVVVHAVGAVPGWSDEAKECLRGLWDGSVRLSVRDEASRLALQKETGRSDVTIARDSGLLAGSLVEIEKMTSVAKADKSPRTVVGLGIIHPAVVAHHGGAIDNATNSFAEMATVALKKGWDVVLFTNGAKEDERQLQRVHAQLGTGPEGGGRLSVSPRPITPYDLAKTINSFDGLIAHRLHACIVAYALDVPAVGLAWDEKVRSFFASVDEGDFVAEAEQPQRAVELLERAMEKGHDPKVREGEIAAARSDISSALSQI